MIPLPFRFPERSLAWGQLRRGAMIWLLLRLAIGVASAIALRHNTHGPLAIAAPAAFWLIALTGALGWVEAQRLNENRFAANLGIPIAFSVLWSILPAVCFETILPLVGVH